MADEINLKTLTPEEFSNYFYEEIKNKLGIYNLQCNKVGLIGFLTNILGNISYDSKLYVDNLFKEAFPATAQLDDKIIIFN